MSGAAARKRGSAVAAQAPVGRGDDAAVSSVPGGPSRTGRLRRSVAAGPTAPGVTPVDVTTARQERDGQERHGQGADVVRHPGVSLGRSDRSGNGRRRWKGGTGDLDGLGSRRLR